MKQRMPNKDEVGEDAREEATETPAQEAQEEMDEQGNTELDDKRVVNNKDGSKSIIKPHVVGIDGTHAVLPAVSAQGQVHNSAAAIGHYLSTGEHLGKFKSGAAAEAHASKAHKQQQALIKKGNETGSE